METGRDLSASERPGRVCEGTKVKAEVEKKKMRKSEKAKKGKSEGAMG